MSIKQLNAKMKAKPHCWWYFVVILTIAVTDRVSAAKQQFRTNPQSLTVLEGSDALLRCEITNLAGTVQWAKDGFALGFSEKIEGFPRYSQIGDRSHGIVNLRITNASLEDDAEYQCQVGPAQNSGPIRTGANLTVISPPSSIEIEAYSHGTKVEKNGAKVDVRENQDLMIACTIANSKPAAQIIWLRGHVEVKSTENRQDRVEDLSNKRFTVTSNLTIKTTSNDDMVDYSCQARHKALSPDLPMRATVQVSVLYPPGEPFIEGFIKGETLRRGQQVELACRSQGGNPAAQLVWYKNNVQIQSNYRTYGRTSENKYLLKVEASDNKARFRCEAQNVISEKPLKKEIDLSVLFPPTQVTISGPSEARAGETVSFSCITAPSNPAAEVRWTIDGRQKRNSTSRQEPSNEGGMVTSSNISFTIDSNKRSFTILCQGVNMQLADNVMTTHLLYVLYPPLKPVITGYVEGSVIPAGSSQKLLCMSSGGNPPATLTWFKNDKKLNPFTKTTNNSVQSELNIIANITDNQAIYRCEAQNSATDVARFDTKTLSVHFLPETLKIGVEPKALTIGTQATLYCNSSSSNPPVKLSWWKDGIPVAASEESSNLKGLWGGKTSSSQLKLNITQDMNDLKITCQGTNDALQRSINEAMNLQVLYPPKFTPPPSSTAVGIEDEQMVISLVANGNPTSIQYTWTKEGTPLEEHDTQRILIDGPTLNFTKLVRDDSGIYSCEALNSQGSTTINITVVVEYGATIKSISDNTMVNPGDEAKLSCTVDGNPLNENHIRWERVDYDLSDKTHQTYDNGTSYLHITNAQRDDIGHFRCIADNRVANPISRDVLLIVKFIPEIDKSPTMLRAASNKNEKARMVCRVQAAPQPTFIWTRSNRIINASQGGGKYSIDNRKIDPLTYESVLIVDKVDTNDYGMYECKSENEQGLSKENVRLDVTSKPDAPLSLNVLNATHDTVSLAWTPGFDGGMKAQYRIRYRESTAKQYTYVDSLPNSHKLIVEGLKKNTLYLFSIMASNRLGDSSWLPDLTKAQTKVAPQPNTMSESILTTQRTETTGSPFMNTPKSTLVMFGIALGICLVVLNILLIACCLHKRHKKNLKGGLEPLSAEVADKDDMPKLLVFGIALVGVGLILANTALVAWFVIRKRIKEPTVPNSKSAAIEMYAPSSYNDTVTGETLSSVSDKSDSYSNDGSQPDLTEEVNRKQTTSTYVVEDTDIPPPRYQKDGRLSPYYQSNPNLNQMMIHPKIMQQQQPQLSFMPQMNNYDDQFKNYVKIPSPGPPMDGSYYSACDRYLSYPPMDHPIEFPVASSTLQHISGQQHQHDLQQSRSNTLNRRNSNLLAMNHNSMIPPPDVTHHTSTASKMPPMMSGTLYKQNNQHPPSILKDPKRNQQQQQQLLQQQQQQQQQQQMHNVNKDLQMQQMMQQHQPMPSMMMDGQISNLSGTQNVLINAYDATNSNLNTFNASLGFPDTDGHLV